RGCGIEGGRGGGVRERDDGEHLPDGGATCRGRALREELVRSQRVIDRRLVFILLLVCLSRKNATPKKAAAPAPPSGPKIRATVVTIETKLASPDRTLRHTITIANGRARSSDELDRWRLFDVKNNRVTFIDDLDKSYRTVSFAQLTADRRGALADDGVPDGLPRAVVAHG